MSNEIDFDELFNDSYERISNNKTEFYDLFYERFLNSSFLVKNAFKNTDMTVQKKMLQKALVHLISFSVSRKASEYLQEIAQKHIELNIHAEMYDLFIHSLLSALSECYPRFSNECAVAWRITLSPGIEFMKHYGDVTAAKKQWYNKSLHRKLLRFAP